MKAYALLKDDALVCNFSTLINLKIMYGNKSIQLHI